MTAYDDFNDNLDDSLDDLIGSEPLVRTQLRRPEIKSAYTTPETHWDTCPKCNGTGSWRGRGTCYACNGQGGKSYKTSAAERQANREKAHDRKERNTQAWIEEHKAEYAWLVATAHRQTDRINAGEQNVWQFPISLCDAVTQYGSLTDNQLAAVRKYMEKDAERKAEWAKQDAARAAAAPEVTADKLQQAFDLARTKAERPGQQGVWIRPLKMFSGEWNDDASEAEKERMREKAIVVEFSPASAKGKNPGAVYAKRNGEYLGKIQGGRWFAARECSAENSAAVVEVCNDPARAAKAYGKAWGVCCVCGRTLTNDISIARGIGPICAEGFGF